MNRNMHSDLLAAACSSLKKTGDGSVAQNFCIGEDFIGFAGHFPGYPIVPAVTQLLVAQLLIEQTEASPLRLQTVSHAKFLLQLLPQQTISVQCREKSGKPLNFDVKIYLGEELASSFRLIFTPREGHDG